MMTGRLWRPKSTLTPSSSVWSKGIQSSTAHMDPFRPMQHVRAHAGLSKSGHRPALTCFNHRRVAVSIVGEINGPVDAGVSR